MAFRYPNVNVEFAPLVHIHTWMGFEHFPCSKCDFKMVTNLNGRREWVFTLGTNNGAFDYDQPPPKDFKTQFLLLHP